MTTPNPEEILAAAQKYISKSWRVIPLHSMKTGHCSCGRPVCNSAGKHPVEPRWQASEPLSGPDLYAHFVEDERNIGIATGAPSGFWVLDLDYDKPGTAERFRELIAKHDEIPQTYCVKTGGGGYQLYWAMPDFNVTNSAKRLPDGVDVRGTGGQVVAPPSVSGKGVYTVVYDLPVIRAPRWLEDLVRPLPPAAPVDLETLPKVTDLPESEQNRLRQYVNNVVGSETARLAECRTKGWNGPGWNDTTFQVSCSLIELANSPWCYLTLQNVHDIVLDAAPRDRGFTDAEVEACFSSALKTVARKGRAMPENRDRPSITVIPGDPLTDPTVVGSPAPRAADVPAEGVKRARTDLGNARRLVDFAGHRLRYLSDAERWASYAEGRWTKQKNAALTAAQEMLETLIEREAHLYDDTPGDNDDPSERETFCKWAIAQQMDARVKACVSQASGRPELNAEQGVFDTIEHLFNCGNGVVDLRTGELLDHDPEFLMMSQSPVKYDPDAVAPLWDKFLERCLPDPEIREYLQMVVGYSMTASMAEQAIFLHHGSGANGKSVFLQIAAAILGTYAQVVPRETLLQKGANSEHPTSVARMTGKRFLQASETAPGRRLDEETVKGLTGGEQQSARYMGADFFDFVPTGKIHLATNHLPQITDAESIWRRMRLFAWTEVIPEGERDPRLADKVIRDEASGVLNWAVAGAVKWYGLNQADRLLEMPARMKRDLANYRGDQDVMGEFIEGKLERIEGGFATSAEIHATYSNWCFNHGIKPMSGPSLTQALKERGLTYQRKAKARGFTGVRVITQARELDALAAR